MENQVTAPTYAFNTADLTLKGFKIYEIDTAVLPN